MGRQRSRLGERHGKGRLCVCLKELRLGCSSFINSTFDGSLSPLIGLKLKRSWLGLGSRRARIFPAILSLILFLYVTFTYIFCINVI